MKMIWHVFVGIILINLLAAAGFVGWMYTDGRINQDRIDRVVDMFKLTINEEQEQTEQAKQLAEKTQQEAEQKARLESVANGPITLRERLDMEKQADETALARIQFFNDQNKALREEMQRFKNDYAQRTAQLESERKAFEDWVNRQADETKDANFQQVVSLYEKQPAKLTKQAFQALIQQGETDQVVEYLAAMSGRKAAQVLSQFKTPAEVVQAADLLEKLRARGEYSMDPQAMSTGNPS